MILRNYFYMGIGAWSVNERLCSQFNTFTRQRPITSCADPHPTYLSCCYQLKGHRELPNFCVGGVGMARSLNRMSEYQSNRPEKNVKNGNCSFARKILLWKSCSTIHLIFLQNNFCGNAAYFLQNKLKKQVEKKQTKRGEKGKLIMIIAFSAFSNFGNCNLAPGAKANVVLDLQSKQVVLSS